MMERREHHYRCSRLLLILFRLVLFLLCFPLGKLPLSFLALEKGLYLREQDTGIKLHHDAMAMNTVVATCCLSRAYKGNISPYRHGSSIVQCSRCSDLLSVGSAKSLAICGDRLFSTE